MRIKFVLFTVILFSSFLINAQKYIEGILVYGNGKEQTALIHKKIEGPFIKIKDTEGTMVKIESSDLKLIRISSKKGEGEVLYEYLHITDHKGAVSKKPFWLNKIIDGQMALYMESFIYAGNPAGSGNSWYFKRKNEKQALLLSPLRLKKQLPDYFKDNPNLAEKIKSGEIYDPREMVTAYNESFKK